MSPSFFSVSVCDTILSPINLEADLLLTHLSVPSRIWNYTSWLENTFCHFCRESWLSWQTHHFWGKDSLLEYLFDFSVGVTETLVVNAGTWVYVFKVWGEALWRELRERIMRVSSGEGGLAGQTRIWTRSVQVLNFFATEVSTHHNPDDDLPSCRLRLTSRYDFLTEDVNGYSMTWLLIPWEFIK